MTHRENFEAVDEILKKLTGVNAICGGKMFIGAGDFRQIPPVVTDGGRDCTIAASVKYSPLWNQVQTWSLTIPMRQLEDLEYAR